uniref:Uncharacterized protein ycf35 n=1 Tax=Dasya naccarioides TaxID=2007180 RepID=A0A1Z1MGL5_9FLOR|nr:hypothetical protein [Dasya naccarioides]ARW65106.1 hypothetical protein [Dasya naccarioides]
MSHFSKIKTNISNLKILKKTLKDLGFYYTESVTQDNYIDVFKTNINSGILFSFAWDVSEYNLIIDYDLWKLNMSIDCFIEKVMQQYAVNIISNESSINGFNQKSFIYMQDGSIKLTVQKWNI